MSDCLFLPMPQRSAGVRELTTWEAVWMPLGEGEAERLTIGRGTGWKPVEVPRHPDRGAVARRKRHLPALARMEAVRRVVDPMDGASEPVGVGLRVEMGLERITRNRLVGG